MLNPVGEVVYRLQSWALLDTNGPAIFFFFPQEQMCLLALNIKQNLSSAIWRSIVHFFNIAEEKKKVILIV